VPKVSSVLAASGGNLGQTGVRAVLAGAKKAVSVEGWPDTVATGHRMAPLTQLQGFQYFEVNFHNVDFDVLIDAVVPEPVDIVLVLSLYRNVDIDHRDRMFAYALRRARVGVVIEGHADSVIDTEQFYRRVLFDHGAAHTV
jgi:hypothetical protein